MNIALFMIICLGVLLAGYHFYGSWLAKKLGIDASRLTPAHALKDNHDYIPTRRTVLFAHHFASIAAAGPIIGPTLAIFYGYIPAIIWMLLGVIFIGAVHDFTSLFVSMREQGKSLAEVARRVLGTPAFIFYISFALILCVLVLAAFMHLAAIALTSHYPLASLGLAADQTLIKTMELGGVLHGRIGGIASTSVVVLALLAPLMGWLMYRARWAVWQMSILAMGICFVSVWVGFQMPISFEPRVWMIIIGLYSLVAAWIPVWVMLQPRDFINVHFLYLGLIALVMGILSSGFNGVSLAGVPAVNLNRESLEALGMAWPFLFVTIACGSVSGAHSLVCGGTSCKQIADERDALPIAYGGMLLETLLGICVILAILGGIGFDEYRALVWPHIGRSNPVLAFALGVGTTLNKGLGLPIVYGTLFGILLLEGFVITTIDTLVRLARYLFEELWNTIWKNAPGFVRSKIFNAFLVVAIGFALAITNGYRALWPIFGSANQLLAALSLITVTAWLIYKGKPSWFAAWPAAFMTVTTMAALVLLLVRFYEQSNWVLFGTVSLLLMLTVGMLFITAKFLLKGKNAFPPPSA